MVDETLEDSVLQEGLKKCGAWFCENIVDVSEIGTSNFIGYIGPIGNGVYCCEKHYDETIDR